MTAWDSLSSQQFESLCCDVLARESYKNITWLGRRGGDRCRDITAVTTLRVAEGIERSLNCIIECKRYVARPPAQSDLEETLSWADAHGPDMLLIIVTNILTADTQDWLQKLRSQKRYDIEVLDEKYLEQFLDRNPDLYLKHFGKERATPWKLTVSSLLRRGDQTVQDISKDTSLPEKEVEEALDDLERLSSVSRQSLEQIVTFRLERTYEAFVALAKEFLADDKHRFEFLANEYSQSAVDSGLVSVVMARYHLVADEEQKTALAKLFRISPSALNAALFSPTDAYDTGYEQIERLGLHGKQRDEWNRLMLTTFISTLLENTVADLRAPHVSATLKQSGVEGCDVRIGIKMASSTVQVLSLESEAVVMLLRKAEGEIKAGQALAATDPDLFIVTGGILTNLELFELAIREYDRAISGLKDARKLAIAWNNKGVCYMSWGREKIPQAISCFDEALEIEPTLEKARENRDKCEAMLRQT